MNWKEVLEGFIGEYVVIDTLQEMLSSEDWDRVYRGKVGIIYNMGHA